MTQQINLLNPAFRRGRLLISAQNVAIGFAVALALMTAVDAYSRHQVATLGTQLSAERQALEAQRTRAAQQAKVTGVTADRELEAEVARLESELKAQRANLAALEGGAIGDRRGFAEYLRAFSRQSLDGLWLTSFSIGPQGEITLKGRVTQPELLAEYIRRLNREPALKGRSFAALEIARPAPRDKDDEAKKIARLPPYLDFTLATTEQAVARAEPVKAGVAP